ncbi:MAG: DUF3021 domain-containing protein [Clostridia bacterium]|nr:DUF3021 domain-containing protein [Clostridia bacterium]
MKKHILEFFLRGLAACGFGPIVLAVLYLILNRHGVIETLAVDEVVVGIFSISALAFVVGGMNVVYKIERLPLMLAILIHGGVLYCSYLATYLVNDWLEMGVTPITVFSCIFVFGYLVIWAVIYSVTKRKTEKLNEMLKRKQSIEQ